MRYTTERWKLYEKTNCVLFCINHKNIVFAEYHVIIDKITAK